MMQRIAGVMIGAFKAGGCQSVGGMWRHGQAPRTHAGGPIMLCDAGRRLAGRAPWVTATACL